MRLAWPSGTERAAHRMTANLRYWRSVVRFAEAALDAATCLSELKVE